MNFNLLLLRKKFDLFACLAAVAGIFFIALSPKIVNILFPLAAVSTIIAGNWRQKWQIIHKNKVIIGGFFLFCLFLVGTTYNLIPLKFALQGLGKYDKLLYLVFLTPLFILPQWRKAAIYALFLGVLVNAIVALLNLWHIPIMGKIAPIGDYFIHPIYISALTAFALFILANWIIDKQHKQLKWLYAIYIILFLLYAYTLFFVYIERTGYVIAFALLALFLWQRWKWRGLIASLLAILLIGSTLYNFSSTFHRRINDGISDIKEYKQERKETSWGYRLEFAKYSFKIIKQRPFFGSGTGSFPVIYKASGGVPLTKGELLGHPHNEYILITFQLGVVGLLVFLLWIAIQWHETFKLPLQYQRLAQGLIVSFLVNSFCNASLYINATGMLYVVFLCVFFATYPYSNERRE